MKRRLVCLVLCFALLLSFAPASVLRAHAASGTCGANLSWSFDAGTGLLAITGSGPMMDIERVDGAPWYEYREQITQISLPQGLTTISDYAFYDVSKITELDLPEGLIEIGYSAITSRPELKNVVLPQSLERLGAYSLADYQLAPEHIETVDDVTYYDNWLIKADKPTRTSETTFSPNDTCTRAQIVTFLYRDLGTK